MENNVYSPHRRRRVLFAAGGFLTAAGLFAAVQTSQSKDPAIALKQDDQPISRSQPEPASFAPMVKRVSPSVVKITTEIHAHRVAMNGSNGAPDDPSFRQFFGGRMPQTRPEPEGGVGSGVIISTDGYIVTNNHVVDGADRLTVTLEDGRALSARVIGRDPQTDIAVVKVDATQLPAITFARSSKIEVGDRVLAIGNPFGIGETVTTGIVSAMGRHAGLGLAYEDFIQTDAAINPGNSGGALVDIDGRLIGINTAILSRSGGSQGVGLAVPADLVRYVADSLVEHGKVVRGYMGVAVQDVTQELADSFGLKSRQGALISEVRPGSPAATAGIQSGDVVTALDGHPVENAGNLSLAVSEASPGTHLGLDLLRNGKPQHIDVTATTKPASFDRSGDEQSALGSNSNGVDQGVLNGVAVDDIDSNARQQMNLPERIQGAVVAEVGPDSPSARAGLRVGDVILEINRHRVTSAKDAIDLCASATGKKTLVKMWSHGSTVYVVDETQPAPGS